MPGVRYNLIMKPLTLRPIRTRGFTIVELLIVIVIIGIMTGITGFAYITTKKNSRDDTRTADITTLKHAVERYYQDNGEYPAICPGGPGIACNVSYLADSLEPYLSDIPHDPKYSGTATDYLYVQNTISGKDAYAFDIHYETQPTCKSGRNMAPSWWNSAPTCPDL